MSYNKPRITSLNMSLLDCAKVLCDGNPGALTAVLECSKIEPTVDPDSALGHFGVAFSLDTLDCYGPRIWLLYKDVCNQKPLLMLAVLRAIQLGIVSGKEVNEAIDNRGRGIDPAALLAKVQGRLPAFGKNSPALDS